MILKSVKTGVVTALLLSTAMITNAQQKFTQGTANFGIDYTLTAEQAGMASQLPKEQKIKFNGNITRVEMEQGPATIGVLQNFVAKTGLILIDVPVIQAQFAVKITKEETEAQEAAAPKFSDFKATGEMQKIGNYNAEKYTYKDSKDGTYELWASKDIELPAGFFGQQFNAVKGALVKYTTFQNGMKMTLTMKNISEEKVGPFSLEVPSGYEIKTMQEVMAMQGGGQ